ncbi:MAG: hypothetical protein PUP91_03245 [Rhizonema sp. PD37]|nr:hypothetical protein [Rhizonema sp. PD37]
MKKEVEKEKALEEVPKKTETNGMDIMIKTFKDGGIGKEKNNLGEKTLMMHSKHKKLMNIGNQ